jgi:hypothetical protein
MKRAVPALCLFVLLAPAALALPRSRETKHDESYYTKKICRSEQAMGSRLETNRRCMTQSEWDLLRMEQRRVVDRIQAMKPVSGG